MSWRVDLIMAGLVETDATIVLGWALASECVRKAHVTFRDH